MYMPLSDCCIFYNALCIFHSIISLETRKNTSAFFLMTVVLYSYVNNKNPQMMVLLLVYFLPFFCTQHFTDFCVARLISDRLTDNDNTECGYIALELNEEWETK